MARPQKFRHDREALKQPHIAMQLAGHVLGIEELRSQAKAIQDEIADAYDALDGDGFEKAMVRKLVGLRAKDFTKRQDEEEGLALYEEAVDRGVSLTHTRRKPETADRSDNGANINMRHSGIATDLPPHDEDGVIFEDEPTVGETGMVLGTGKERPMPVGGDADSDPEARFETASLHQSDDDAFAAVTVTDQLADTMGVEPSPSEPNSVHVGDERTEQPEDGLSASGDNSEITHSAAPSRVADVAAGDVYPASPAAFSSPDPLTPQVDDGRPEPSSDALPSGQGGVAPVGHNGKSGQQPASAAQDRNEPVSVSGASATISEADVPDFLKRKEGCLDQAGCKVKTYSILCARCAAERARARAAA